jgi:hypothetical protein
MGISVGFDLDGVIYPWHSSIYRYFIEFKGYEDSYFKFWSEDWKIPEIQEHIGFLTTVPTFCEDSEPFPRALETLHEIEDKGHTIFYITSRPDEVRFATWHYIDRRDFPFKENLHIVNGEKATLARSLGLDLFVDDREKHVKELTPVCLTVLMATPWNLDFQELYPTIHNIHEIMDYIKE